MEADADQVDDELGTDDDAVPLLKVPEQPNWKS
jgi:hypothetical protein